eukprot:c9291_g1_i2.p2 GENE.c9291_g1_i2~~c9291_g1_i2.p2  ORF type:complete len:190 (+),score=39.35 c9291_g1_i2:270-839(+)
MEKDAVRWHELECSWYTSAPKQLTSNPEIPTEYLRFALRYEAAKRQPNEFQSATTESFNRLCAHHQFVSDERSRVFAMYAAIVSVLTKSPRKELYGLFVRRMFNAHAIPARKGWILAPEASFFNHSCCEFNTHVTVDKNGFLIAKTACDVEQGKELLICYVDADTDTLTRQADLANTFCFVCTCRKCTS